MEGIKMYYFKSYYIPCSYISNWYGEFDYAPPATVLMYNDEEGFCIGTMDEKIDGVTYISESEALITVNKAKINNPNVFVGYKLHERWDCRIN